MIEDYGEWFNVLWKSIVMSELFWIMYELIKIGVLVELIWKELW